MNEIDPLDTKIAIVPWHTIPESSCSLGSKSYRILKNTASDMSHLHPRAHLTQHQPDYNHGPCLMIRRCSD